MPAEAYALAHFEDRDVGGDRIEDAGYFMAGGARELEAGPEAKLGEGVAVTNAAGMDANADLSRAGLGELFLNQLKGSAGCGNLHGTTCDGGHGEGFLLGVKSSAAGFGCGAVAVGFKLTLLYGFQGSGDAEPANFILVETCKNF
jgi:hypothetical protein